MAKRDARDQRIAELQNTISDLLREIDTAAAGGEFDRLVSSLEVQNARMVLEH